MPIPLPEVFVELERAACSLEGYFRAQNFDCTPIILSQPPSRRDSRLEALMNAKECLELQQSQFQSTYERLTAIRHSIQQCYAMCCTALSPVSALPHEILRRVFEYVDAAQPMETRAESTRIIAAVSRDWKNVAVAIPRLWSYHHIHAFRKIPPFILSLPNPPSQKVSLFFDTSFYDNDNIDWTEDYGLLQDMLVYLEWSSTRPIRYLFDLMSGWEENDLTFSVLETLKVIGIRPSREEAILHLDDIKFSNLRHLSLNRARMISGNHTLTSELEDLYLESTYLEPPGPNHLLFQAPKLRSITMDSCSVVYSPDFITELWKLPSLEDLLVLGGSGIMISSLLGLITTPSLRTLQLLPSSCDHEPEGSPWCNTPTVHSNDYDVCSLSSCLYRTVSTVTTTTTLVVTFNNPIIFHSFQNTHLLAVSASEL